MIPALNFSRTGPADALAMAAARLRVEIDPDALADAFDRHTSPLSLRALVEIAPKIGVEARVFRSDLAGLDGARLPAIVHLIDRGTEESGFAVLIERSNERVRLIQRTDGKETSLATSQFESVWSGVVVTLKVAEGAHMMHHSKHGAAPSWLRAWYRRDEPLARASLVARAVSAALFIVLTLAAWGRWGSAEGAPSRSLIPIALALLASCGLLLSAALFFKSRRSLVPGAAPRLAATICGRGPLADCLGVLSSRYSRFAGIDWASIGLAYFSSTLLLLAAGALLQGSQRAVLLRWLAVAAFLALPGSIALIAVQIYPLRRICTLCMAVHGVIVGSAALGVLILVTDVRATGRWTGLIPIATMHAAAFMGMFGLLVPLLALGLEARVNRIRLGWLAATPWGALAELAGRPRSAAEISEAAIRLGASSAPFHLSALVHPVCSGCAPVVSKLRALAAHHPESVSLGFHLPPRDAASRADLELCTAINAAGLLGGGDTGLDAFLAVKGSAHSMIETASAGAGAVLARLLPGRTADEDTLARARQAVRDADRLAEKLERGTPTLLLNGRLWDGTVEDLDALLTRHSPLLADALRLRSEGTPSFPPQRSVA